MQPQRRVWHHVRRHGKSLRHHLEVLEVLDHGRRSDGGQQGYGMEEEMEGEEMYGREGLGGVGG